MIEAGITWIAYYFLHSFTATFFVKHVFRKLDDHPGLTYRLVYTLFAVATFAVAFLLHLQFDAGEVLLSGEVYMFIGLAIQLAGLTVLYYAFKAYSLREFLGLKKEEKHRLVTEGLNALVRHPIYFATLIILAGYFLYSPSQKNLVFVLVSILYLYIGSWFEEKRLIREFGDAYIQYQKKAKRILPFIF